MDSELKIDCAGGVVGVKRWHTGYRLIFNIGDTLNISIQMFEINNFLIVLRYGGEFLFHRGTWHEKVNAMPGTSKTYLNTEKSEIKLTPDQVRQIVEFCEYWWSIYFSKKSGYLD